MSEGKYIPQPGKLDTSGFSFPEQPAEDPVIREVKNKVCLEGHLDEALKQILGNTSPDGISAILTQLAHRSVELAFAAQEAASGTIETLRKGFCTTESCGPDKHYLIKIRFQSLPELQQAEHELRGMMRRELMYSVPVAKVKVLPGRERVVQKTAMLEVLGDGVALFADARGPFQRSVQPLPPPTTYLRWKGDGQFGGYVEVNADSPGAIAVYTDEQLRNYRDDREHPVKPPWVQIQGAAPSKPVSSIEYQGTVKTFKDLPSPAFHEDTTVYLVTDDPDTTLNGLYILQGDWRKHTF